MNTYLQMAQFNSESTNQVLKLVDSLSQSEREKESGSYFNTPEGCLNHLYRALAFVSRSFKGLPEGEKVFADAPHHWAEQPDELRTPMFDSYDELRKNLIDLNERVLKLHKEVDEKYVDYKIVFLGKTIDFGKISLFIFHHQTHHRGQLSQILDEMEIKHDLSDSMRTVFFGDGVDC